MAIRATFVFLAEKLHIKTLPRISPPPILVIRTLPRMLVPEVCSRGDKPAGRCYVAFLFRFNRPLQGCAP
jgi:hypothetical protein